MLRGRGGRDGGGGGLGNGAQELCETRGRGAQDGHLDLHTAPDF